MHEGFAEGSCSRGLFAQGSHTRLVFARGPFRMGLCLPEGFAQGCCARVVFARGTHSRLVFARGHFRRESWWGCSCTRALHKDVVLGLCLHERVAQGSCTGALEGSRARVVCMRALHEGSVLGLCLHKSHTRVVFAQGPFRRGLCWDCVCTSALC